MVLGDIFHASVFVSGYVIDDHTRYIDNLNDGFKGGKWLCQVSTISGRLIWLM